MASAMRSMSVASIPRPMIVDIIYMLPQPTEAFEWVQAAAGPALVCRPLLALARHLYTTRLWPLGRATSGDSEVAWSDVANAIGVGPGRLARAHQVHGSRAVEARAGDRPDADIVFTHDPDIGIAIQTADCIPLLIVDSRTGVTAAVHAGWRGLAARAP